MITFQTAYLKTYYPAEFMAALLTSEEGNTDKISKYIDEASRLGIGLLPPSINQSLRGFSVVDDENSKSGTSIIYGLGAIKGVGGAAIENILELQSEAKFQSIDDFASRVDNFRVNKKVIESLIYAGAMDCLGKSRLAMIQNMENILRKKNMLLLYFREIFSLSPWKKMFEAMKSYDGHMYVALSSQALVNFMNYVGFLFIPLVAMQNNLSLSEIAILFAVMRLPYLVNILIGNI